MPLCILLEPKKKKISLLLLRCHLLICLARREGHPLLLPSLLLAAGWAAWLLSISISIDPWPQHETP